MDLNINQLKKNSWIFWLLVMITSALGMAIIFRFTLQNSQQDVISINVETSFLHWTNTFPAISICLTKGGSATKIKHYMNTYWQSNNITPPASELGFAFWIRLYLFVSPNQNIDEHEYCKSQNKTCGFDVDLLMKAFLPQRCSDFMSELTFLDRTYECNDIFKPIQTEMGQCFTANSLYVHKDSSQLPLLYDQSHRRRTLSFTYREKLDVFQFVIYIHSPEELPFFDMEPTFLHRPDLQYFFYETIEIVNSNDVRFETIAKRNCRFPDEKMDNSILPYSFSSCFTEKRIALQLELCNCTIHTSPTEYSDRYCDYEGLLCIGAGKYGTNLSNGDLFPIKTAGVPERIKSNYKSQEMCMVSCIEMEINSLGEIIENTMTVDTEENKTDIDTEQSGVVIEVLNKPTLRYVRNVTKTKLDFVVSIGGLVGLFFGASLLSLVELIYIWLIRRF